LRRADDGAVKRIGLVFAGMLVAMMWTILDAAQARRALVVFAEARGPAVAETRAELDALVASLRFDDVDDASAESQVSP
jgi:hypothetical protein